MQGKLDWTIRREELLKVLENIKKNLKYDS